MQAYFTPNLRRIYASASPLRISDKMVSHSCVTGCAGPKTRRRLWTTSCMMISASIRSSPVLTLKTWVAESGWIVYDSNADRCGCV